MLAFVLRLAINAAALVALTQLAPQNITVTGWPAAFIVAIFLGFANALVKPVLLFFAKLLTLPLGCLTLGLSNLVISLLLSGAIVSLVDALLPDFKVQNFVSALGVSLVMGVVNALASALIPDGKKREEQ